MDILGWESSAGIRLLSYISKDISGKNFTFFVQRGISFFALEKTQPAQPGAPMNSLTNRKQEIVFALAEGLSNKDIGRKLNLSEGTVKVHLHNIYSKLGVKNRTALAVLAFTESAWVKMLPHTANSERAELEFA